MRFLLIVTLLLQAGAVLQATAIPDEYRATGGHGIGLGHAAIVANTGIASTVLNPAMIALERSYQLSLGYTWPAAGREFYQVGIVDGKTSRVAAGLLYTGFHEDFDAYGFLHQELDTPVKRRGVLALSTMIGKISLGINGVYVEGYQFQEGTHGLLGLTNADHRYPNTEPEKKRGVATGIGLAAAITPTLRFGASIINLANRKIRDFAPRTIRGGLAYLLTAKGEITLHLDYHERERIALFEKGETKPERLTIASCSVLIYNVARLLAAYEHDLSNTNHEIAAGITLVSNKMSLSYGFKKSLTTSRLQQAINLGLTVAI